MIGLSSLIKSSPDVSVMHCLLIAYSLVTGELKSTFSSSEQKSQNTAIELVDLKKKLRDHKKSADSAETNAKKYRIALESLSKNMSEHISLVDKAIGSESKIKKESPVKSEVNGEK